MSNPFRLDDEIVVPVPEIKEQKQDAPKKEKPEKPETSTRLFKADINPSDLIFLSTKTGNIKVQLIAPQDGAVPRDEKGKPIAPKQEKIHKEEYIRDRSIDEIITHIKGFLLSSSTMKVFSKRYVADAESISRIANLRQSKARDNTIKHIWKGMREGFFIANKDEGPPHFYIPPSYKDTSWDTKFDDIVGRVDPLQYFYNMEIGRYIAVFLNLLTMALGKEKPVSKAKIVPKSNGHTCSVLGDCENGKWCGTKVE